jgi:signal transduction histidine kinase
MHKVQDGDLQTSVTVWADDEIGEVQDVFNHMVVNLREACDIRDQQQLTLEAINAENTRLLDELNQKNQYMQVLFERLISTQEDERRRLARELHDETGQALTAMLLHLKTLHEEDDLDIIHDRVNGLRYLANKTLEEVRRLAMDLRPTVLDDLGLIPAIRWIVEESNLHSGMQAVFHAPATLERLPADVETVLYRAAQEGLTNILRHAKAENASVTLEYDGRTIWMKIIDDGKGFDPRRVDNSRVGLIGMQERVHTLKGSLVVDSFPGSGTRLLIEIPCREVEEGSQ